MVTEIEIVISPSIVVDCSLSLVIIKNHASLENLDYAHSGHTGFASSEDVNAKVDKTTDANIVYATNLSGGQYKLPYSVLVRGHTLPQRDSNGQIECGTPTSNVHATPKKYVDDLVASRCEVVETGALVKKLYSEISMYKLVFLYGYRDALNAPNQFMFAFMPDELVVDGEDLQFYAIAGSSNWEYPLRIKRHSDGYVYWWSAYDYSGNTRFYVTKIVGVR